MTTSIMLILSLNLAHISALESQQTAVEPKSAIEIVRDLNERLKAERARHQRDEAVDLRVGPGSSKAELDTYRLRIGTIEKKTEQLTTQTAGYGVMIHRLGGALARIEAAPEADKTARTKAALDAFANEGLMKLPQLQRVKDRPRKEAIEAMNQILAALNLEAATQNGFIAELSQMLTEQKQTLANCERAADREDAAQRKLDGLNLAIFALDGTLRVVGANSKAK